MFYQYLGSSFKFCECKSFLESNSLEILALCETNLDDSIDPGNFFVRVCFPLIQNDSVTHMQDVSLGLISWYLSLENSVNSYVCLWQGLLFFLLITFFVLMHGFWCYFIQYRWGSLDQLFCQCVCLWRH